jgi:hypothetical protein
MSVNGVQANGQNLTQSGAQVVAFYLPQFHPIPENDDWWGPGFTEWTNVARARPKYPGHYQPHLPGELGFYDLRVPETRQAQAALAADFGVSAFCYWHYWFGGGRRLLERPFEEVLHSGTPDFPFCIGWANETWSGIWHGAPGRTLIEQTYLGDADLRAHFDAVLPAFFDQRYFRIGDRPLFYVYRPAALPEPQRFLDLWRTWANRAGLADIFFVGHAGADQRLTRAEFDAFVVERALAPNIRRRDLHKRLERRSGLPRVRSYRRFSDSMPLGLRDGPSFPLVMPGWDSTPRSDARGIVLQGATPEIFENQVARATSFVCSTEPMERRVVFLKAWNEWAEGCHMEPDRRFGRAFLTALKSGIARGCQVSPEPNPSSLV